MKCNECGKENRPIAKYCKYCGIKLLTAEADESSLGNLIGLTTIRSELDSILQVISRMKLDGHFRRLNFNIILVGNSGTAKSLIGTLFFAALKRLKVLTKDNPYYLNAPDFDQLSTEDAVRLLKSNMGGMIVIDNCHELFSDGDASENLKALVAEMGEGKGYQNDPILVLSGLPIEFREFLAKPDNSYFTARFGKIFQIADYNADTLTDIIIHNLRTRYGFLVTNDAQEKLQARSAWLVRESRKPDGRLSAINGHLALKEAESLVFKYYERNGSGKVIAPEDISNDILKKKSAEEILKTFNTFVGMDSIKADVAQIFRKITQDSEVGKKSDYNLHAVITGNPGTGKTTVVRVLGDVYAALGVLDIGHVVEVDRSKLVAGFLGQTAIQVNKMVDAALGGILFVDEAYALKQGDNDSFGQEAIDTLLKRVEDDRGKFCCIVAGYKNEMKTFMSSNPGLESRFPKRFHLEDYTATELKDIFLLLCKAEGMEVAEGVVETVITFFEERIARKTKDFSNGREARNLFEKARNNQVNRIDASGSRDGASIFVVEDIPSSRDKGEVTMEGALARLNEFIGLAGVKNKVKEIADTLEVNRLMGTTKPLSEHFTFIGNPGTGKTSVARVLTDIFYAIGLISTRVMIETDRVGMVAQYMGQTAKKTNELIDRAMGGILFIDEAYTLKQGNSDSFGQEAIDTLLKRMEDDRGKFVVIAAGYKKEMHDFINTNSGLQSRFTSHIEFEDYSVSELAQIFRQLCSKEGYQLDKGADANIEKLCEGLVMRKTKTFANAREARNLFTKTISNLSKRIVALKQEGLSDAELQQRAPFILLEDLPLEGSIKRPSIEEALAPLNEQIGLHSVKDCVKDLIDKLAIDKIRGTNKLTESHFVFIGNPGTGKTTVARIMADIFYAAGILPSNTLIECDRSLLVAAYLGQTAIKTNDLVDRAMGGVLFVDEAYTLSQSGTDNFGQEAIDTLLKRLEDDRGKFICIVAGYKKEMKDFINANSGLASRFTDYIEFEDYKGPEMAQIFLYMARKSDYVVEPELQSHLVPYFTHLYEGRDTTFANARTVRGTFSRTEKQMSKRLQALKLGGGLTDAEIKARASTLTKEDFILGNM